MIHQSGCQSTPINRFYFCGGEAVLSSTGARATRQFWTTSCSSAPCCLFWRRRCALTWASTMSRTAGRRPVALMMSWWSRPWRVRSLCCAVPSSHFAPGTPRYCQEPLVAVQTVVIAEKKNKRSSLFYNGHFERLACLYSFGRATSSHRAGIVRQYAVLSALKV